jgi:hypothetical protein
MEIIGMSTPHIKVYLTSDQMRWVEARAKSEKSTLSKTLVSLVEEYMEEKSTELLLRKVLESLSRLEGQQAILRAQVVPQLDASLTYVKEIFRESSANLYRMNAVIDEMPNGLSLRQRLNEFVRDRERELHERTQERSQELGNG